MGRGRAKAKQTKVARELKYSSPSTDFDTLQRELSGHPTGAPRTDAARSEPRVEDPVTRWDEDAAPEDWSR